MRRWFGFLLATVLSTAVAYGQVDFATQIQPLFTKYGCVNCHGGNGGLFLTSYDLLMTTGNDGPVVVPGDTNSLIVLKLKGTAPFGSRMPLGGNPIDPADLALIVQWIKEGAKESITTAVGNDNSPLPTHPVLGANYPNPFNPSTTISFEIPRREHVRLEVFTIAGARVAQLIDGELDAGRYQTVFQAGDLSSGVYLYRLTSGRFAEVRRMVLLR